MEEYCGVQAVLAVFSIDGVDDNKRAWLDTPMETMKKQSISLFERYRRATNR